MKKKCLFFTMLLVATIGFLSCEDNLEPEVFNRLSPYNFPETTEDYLTLVTGIYGQFRGDNAWHRYSCNENSRFGLGMSGTDEYYTPWGWSETPQKNFDFNPGYDQFNLFY